MATTGTHSYLISRVNPVGSKSSFNGANFLKISRSGSIQLSSPTSNQVERCHVNACCEYLNDDANTNESQRFASQEEVFDKFNYWLERREKNSRSCVLVVGCRGSGKSHTLFGRNNHIDRGIVPRYLENVFDSPGLTATIQMVLVENEQVRDLLDYPSVYPLKFSSCLTNSLGAVDTRSKIVSTSCLSNALEVLGMGLTFLSIDCTVRSRPFSCVGNLIVTITVLEKANGALHKIDFVEMADLINLIDNNQADTTSRLHKSTNSIGLYKNKSDYPQYSSALGFLLQDSLLNELSCCILACLIDDATEDRIHRSNEQTIKFVAKMSNYFAQTEPIAYATKNLSISEKMAIDVEETHRVIGCLSTDLSALETIENRTIHQQMTEKERAQFEGRELDNWLRCVERDIGNLMRFLPASVEYQLDSEKMHQYIADKYPMSQQDPMKLKKELTLRFLLWFFKRKESYLAQWRLILDTKNKMNGQLFCSGNELHLQCGEIEAAEEWIISRRNMLDKYGVFDLSMDSNNSLFWKKIENSARSVESPQPQQKRASNSSLGRKIYLIPITPSSISQEYGKIFIQPGYTMFLRGSIYCDSSREMTPHEIVDEDNLCSKNIEIHPGLNSHGSSSIAESPKEKISLSSSSELLHSFKNFLYSDASCVRDVDLNEFRVIQVYGDSIEALHCVIVYSYDEDEIHVQVEPFPIGIEHPSDLDLETCIMAPVSINGECIRRKTRLNSGDLLCFGNSNIFKIFLTDDKYISSVDDTRKNCVHSTWDEAMRIFGTKMMIRAIEDSEMERILNVHVKKVDRYVVKIARDTDLYKNPWMKLETYKPREADIVELIEQLSSYSQAKICELILACRSASHMSTVMGRDAHFSVVFREIDKECSYMYEGIYYHVKDIHLVDASSKSVPIKKLYASEVLGRVIEGDGSNDSLSWYWSHHTFIDRYHLMQEMYQDFMGSANESIQELDVLYSPARDPYTQIPEDLLIGASYIYPDAMLHMLDIEEILPIVNFKGYICGSIQVSIRCWINKIDVAPAYLSADKECALEEFADETIIMRFNFESLHDLPVQLCTHNRLTFKFFHHTSMYSTPSTSGASKNPFLGKAIIIEQLITSDFIDFLQRGCIEIEVWGGAVKKESETGHIIDEEFKNEYYGDP